ncbi:MAG: methyltransferase domain-containing protein [Dehalococcoidia bacterium]|nr:methyltransferase domain-containing protein [Dehalococcoidia bacterium]
MSDITYEQAVKMDHLMSHGQFTDVLFPEMFTLAAPVGKEMVLDVGTGTGHLAHALSHKLNDGCIIGIDDSDAMLQVAKEKAVKEKIANYFPIRAKAEEMFFKDSTFDLAFCVRVLHHFDNPLAALKEIKRVLKADGHLMLCEPLGPNDGKLREVLTESFQAAHPDYKFYSQEMLEGMLNGAGFQEIRGTEAALSYNQEGLGGVPMGPHYMEAYHLVRMRKNAELMQKFNEQVFEVTEGPGGKIFIHGSLVFLVTLLGKKTSARK